MAIEIFKLVGSIFVDSAEADKSLSKTDEKAKGVGSTLANGAKTAGKWALGIGAAAGAAGAALVAAAKDEAANLDVIDKASQRMKISAEAYQELAYAANLSGVEMSTLEKAAKKLEGTDLNFDDAISQIMSIGDESERTQAAIDLFGESVAYQMTPLLSAGADGLASMRQEANELGLVMSGDVVSAGATMNDSFTKVQEGLGAMKTSLVSGLMPFVQMGLDWVVQHMPEIQAIVTEVTGTISNVITSLSPVITKVFEIAGTLWNTTLKPVLNGIISFVTGVFSGDWEKAWNGVKEIFSGIASGLGAIFKDPINFIINGINTFIRGINRIKIPDWVPGVGGKGFHINEIPNLETGAVLEKGQTGFLEGNGAEAVVPLDRNQKWIHAVAEDMKAAGIGGDDQVLALLADILAKLEDLIKAGIYIDKDILVGVLAGPMDKKLGMIAAQKARS